MSETLAQDGLQAPGDAARSTPVSLVHRRKGSSVSCAIEFHATQH
jgi:hypothetical protein